MKSFQFYADAIAYAFKASGPVSMLVEDGRSWRHQYTVDYYWTLVDGEYQELAA